MKNLLQGKRIKLTAIEKKDIPKFTEWYNDTNFMRYYDVISAVPKTTEEVEKIVYEVTNSNEQYIFAIRDIESGEFIGVTGFENILWNNGTALIYIGIGNEKYRGMGIGEEAMQLAIEFGFREFNFYKIWLTVLEYNFSAIKLYEKIGFEREGVNREFIYRDGKRYDLYNYGLFRSNWILKA